MDVMYALWLETRNAFWTVAGLLPALVVMGLVSAPPQAVDWQHLLEGPLFVTFGLAAVALCDGIATGTRKRPSLLYTLSLPITRRELFLGRTFMGLTQGAALIVGGNVLVWALLPALRAHVGAAGILGYALLVLGGQTLFCGVRVLLSTFVGPWWSLTVVLVLFEAAVIARINAHALPEGHAAREAFNLLVPLLAPRPAASVALCLGTATAMIWLAVARFERRDF